MEAADVLVQQGLQRFDGAHRKRFDPFDGFDKLTAGRLRAG